MPYSAWRQVLIRPKQPRSHSQVRMNRRRARGVQIPRFARNDNEEADRRRLRVRILSRRRSAWLP